MSNHDGPGIEPLVQQMPDARIAQFCDTEFRKYCLVEFAKIEKGISDLGERMGSLENTVTYRRAQEEVHALYLRRIGWFVTTLIALGAMVAAVVASLR